MSFKKVVDLRVIFYKVVDLRAISFVVLQDSKTILTYEFEKLRFSTSFPSFSESSTMKSQHSFLSPYDLLPPKP